MRWTAHPPVAVLFSRPGRKAVKHCTRPVCGLLGAPGGACGARRSEASLPAPPATAHPLTEAAEQAVDSRDNVEDALTKMQKAIDSAAKSIIPKAPNLAKKKQIDKQCACHPPLPSSAHTLPLGPLQLTPGLKTAAACSWWRTAGPCAG